MPFDDDLTAGLGEMDDLQVLGTADQIEVSAEPAAAATPAKPRAGRRRGKKVAQTQPTRPVVPISETPPVSTPADINRILGGGRPSRPRFEDFAPKDYFGNPRPAAVDPALSRRVQMTRDYESRSMLGRRAKDLELGAARTGAALTQAGINLSALDPIRGRIIDAVVGEGSWQKVLDREKQDLALTREYMGAQEAAAPGAIPATTRMIGELGTGLPAALGAAQVGGIPALTAWVAAQQDWENDPVGAALVTGTAWVPIKAGQAISPLAARAGLAAATRPSLQKALQLGIEGATGGAMNVGLYAGTQAALGRPISLDESIAQGVGGAAMSAGLARNIDVAARQPLPKLPNIRQKAIDLGIVEPLRPGRPPSTPALDMLNMGVDPTYIRKLLPSWQDLKYTFPGIFGERPLTPEATKEVNAQVKTLETMMSRQLMDVRANDIAELNAKLEEIDNRDTPPEGWYVLPFADEPRYYFVSKDPEEKLDYGQRDSFASYDRAVKDLNSKVAAGLSSLEMNRIEAQYRQANRAMQQWMTAQAKSITERYRNTSRPTVPQLESRVTDDPQGIVTHNISTERLNELLRNAAPREAVKIDALKWGQPTGANDTSLELATDQFGNKFRIVKIEDPTIGGELFDLRITNKDGQRIDNFDDGPFYSLEAAREGASTIAKNLLPDPTSIAGSLDRAVQPMPSLGVISPDKAMSGFGGVTLVGTPDMLFKPGDTGMESVPAKPPMLAWADTDYGASVATTPDGKKFLVKQRPDYDDPTQPSKFVVTQEIKGEFGDFDQEITGEMFNTREEAQAAAQVFADERFRQMGTQATAKPLTFSADPDIPWIQNATGKSGQTYTITNVADGSVVMQITMGNGTKSSQLPFKTEQEAIEFAQGTEAQRGGSSLKPAIPPPIIYPTDFFTPTVGSGLGWGQKLTPENAPGVMAGMRREGVRTAEERLSYPAKQVFETGYLFTGYAKGGGYRTPEELRAGLESLSRAEGEDFDESNRSRQRFNLQRREVSAALNDLEAREINALMARPLESFATEGGDPRANRIIERQKLIDKWIDIKDDVPFDIDQLLFVTMQKETLPSEVQLLNDLYKIVGQHPELAKARDLEEKLGALAKQALGAFQDARDLKINYMEAQPNRLVGLNEYVAALVPAKDSPRGWATAGDEFDAPGTGASAKNDALARDLEAEGMRVYRYNTEAEKVQIQQALAQYKAVAVDPESGYGALYSNPMFDPSAWRRFVSPLFRRGKRPQDQPLTPNQQQQLDPSDPNYLTAQQRSQAAHQVQQTIDNTMRQSAAGPQQYYNDLNQAFERSKQSRTQARRRLQRLQALQDQPEYVDPVRAADLDQAIQTARRDREQTLRESQAARRQLLIAENALRRQQQQEMRTAAEGRLATPDISYPVDPRVAPIESILNPGEYTLFRAFHRVMTDAMIARGEPLDPNENVTPQFLQRARADHTPLVELIPMIEQQGMDLPTFFDSIAETARLAGQAQREPSAARRASNLMVRTNPAAAEAAARMIPSMRDINRMYRERSNLERFMSIYSGTLTSLLETAQRNLASTAIVTGFDSMGQLLDSAVQYTVGSRLFDNKANMSPALAIRPTLNLLGEFARSVAGLDYRSNSGKVSRVMAAFEAAFPKEVGQELISILDSDDETRRLPGMETTPQLLARWKQEAEQLPDTYKRKPKLLEAIAKAEGRYADLQKPLARTLIRSEKVVHALNLFNRAQETIARRAIFEAKVRRYATEAGHDIDQLVTDGQVATLPVEIVKRAADEAMRQTFAKRPERGSYLWSGHRFFTKGPVGAAVKLGFFPFVNFMGNYIKFAYDYSPAGLIGSPLFSARERANISKGDLSVLWKGLFGMSLYAMATQMRHEFYEGQGSQMGSEEEPFYQKGRKIFEKTGTPLSAGERWFEVKMFDRNIDMRFTPFAPIFLLADMQERNRRGLGDITGRDLMGALGGNMRGMDQFGDTVTSAIEGIRDAEKMADAGKISGKYLGAIAAGFLTPLKYGSDLAQSWDPEERKKRDLNQAEGFAGAFIGPIQERVPYWRQSLPETESPTRVAAPMPRGAAGWEPPFRQLTGLPLIEPKNWLETQLDSVGIKPFEIAPRTGVAKVDRVINREMGKYMEGAMAGLSQSPAFTNLSAERRRQILIDDIFPAFHKAVRDQALAEFPEEMVKAAIVNAFSAEQRNVEDRRRKQQGQPGIAEDVKQQTKQRLQKPELPMISPTPVPAGTP